MQKLRNKLYAFLTGNTALAVLVGNRIYAESAVSDAEMPYVVWSIGPSYSTERGTIVNTRIEGRTVTFLAYANTDEDAAVIVRTIEREFGRGPMNLVDDEPADRIILIEPGTSELMQEPERDITGDEVWQASLQLDFTLQLT